MRLRLTLDHTPLRLGANDVILYRVSPSLDRPPLFEPGPDYEPASPAWIAGLVEASDGGTDMLWARAFSLTTEATLRRHHEAEQRAREASAARKAEIEAAGLALRRGLVGKVTGSLLDPADLPFVDLKRVVRAAKITPDRWSTRHCLIALRNWSEREAERRLDA